MTATQRELLERLELHRLAPLGRSDYAYAERAFQLASEIESEHAVVKPTAEAFAILWMCLEFAEACERRLAQEDRFIADDNGQSASQRIRALISRMTTAVLM